MNGEARRGTVMLIEDDEEMRAVIAHILAENGYHVRIGSDVTDLYEIEKHPPDLLLIDNWLEGKTGHDICYQLKSSPKTEFIPVVLISATQNLELTAQSCLADGFIRKPFEMDDLLSKIATYLYNSGHTQD